MELKKSPEADLQNKRLLFFEIGLSISLLAVVLAFSLNSGKKRIAEVAVIDLSPIMTEEIMEITRQDRRIPPPQPQRQQVQIISEIIQIVQDDTEIETEINWDDFDEDASISVSPSGGGLSETVDFGDEIFMTVEEEPQFMGRSWESFHFWVLRQVKYPKEAIKNKIHGEVTVRFIIEKDGSLSNIEVVSSPSPLLSNEAVRVVKESPKWTPGKQRNQPVRVRFEIPVDFALE